MSHVILRRTDTAAISPEEYVAVISAGGLGRVLHRSDDTILLESDPINLSTLRKRLIGWIVVPQGSSNQVPDARWKVQ